AAEAVKQGFIVAVEAALALGGPGRAEEFVGLVEGVPPGERPPLLTAQASRFRARLAMVGAATEDVVAGFKTAGGMFRELDTPFWLAVTLLEHGEWLASQDRNDEATPLLGEAREIFERLEARPWLERLDRVRVAEPAAGGAR